MDDNYVILGFGVIVILLGAIPGGGLGPRRGPYRPMTKTLRIALVTYGALVVTLAVSRLLRTP